MTELLLLLVPLLLGVGFGYLARRPAFGATLTAGGLVGLLVTWALFAQGDRDLSGDLFDAFFEAVFRFVLLLGLALAFGFVGLVGVGALIGSALRGPTAGPRDNG